MSSQELVALVYVCHECENSRLESRNFRSHLLTHHSISLPKLKRGQRHYNSTEHIFVKQNNINTEQVVNKRFACPSCLAHLVSYDEYKTHVTSSHTDLGVDSVVLPQKRKKDSAFLFSKTIRSYSKPKFPQKYIDKLKFIVTIDQKEANKTNISTLNQFIHVKQLLQESLNQELENLPPLVSSFKIAADLEEQKLINVTKFILTSFANTCSKMAIDTKPCKDYVRTFWILHAVRIFQTFSNQTGLLPFNWCEIPLTEDEDGPKAVDGIGYDLRSKDRLVYEASSGQYNANYDKIIDDNTKQISSMIMMLKEITNSHVNSDFNTFTKSKVSAVRSIKTKIVLSELILK